MKYIDLKSRRYLGNKYSLIPIIEEALGSKLDEINSVADVFSGTGVVGEYFLNKGKNVIFNDLLYSNKIIYKAWFGEKKYDEDKTTDIINRYNNLDSKKLSENYFSDNFKDTYFSHENCKKIGYIREDIERMFLSKEINEREHSILVASLIYSMDRISNTVGHYDSYLLSKVGLKPEIELVHPKIKKYKKGKVEIFNKDANKLVKKIEADLVYIDPPYNSRQYSDLYHLLENVAEWKKPPVQFKAKKMDRTHIKSLYSMNEATVAFEDLINNIKSKYILVSYNNMAQGGNGRSNAKINDENLLRILNKKGKVKIIEKQYNAFTTGKSKNTDIKERLFLCKVNKYEIKKEKEENSEIAELIKTSFNYTGGKYKLLPQLLECFPEDFSGKTFVDLFSGGGNVGINIPAKKIICNDINNKLIRLFRLFQRYDFNYINKKISEIITEYNLSDSSKNGYEYYGCNSSNGLGKYNKEKYLKLREDYNKINTSYKRDFLFMVLLIYSFNNQIRFNKKNEFNLPVGKRDFNSSMQKNLYNTVTRVRNLNIEFLSKDFKKINIKDYENPFVYCDPPYTLGTATYNENGGWSEKDDKKLFDYLDELNINGIPFSLSNVIEHKGKKNERLLEWVIERGYNLIHLNHNYSNSSYNKKNTKSVTKEILITNYIK